MSFEDYIKRITANDKAVLEELSADHDAWGEPPLTELPAN
jgi:hypothetical protein